MNLVELPGQSETELPVLELRAHLRMGTGFTDDTMQDPILIRALKAAVAQIEGAIGKAPISRTFLGTVSYWRDLGRQVLPRAPLQQVDSLTVVDAAGVRGKIALGAIHVSRDAHRPALVAKGFVLPSIPVGGHAEVAFTAGYGNWDDIPQDLQLAVLTLAAGYYEDRSSSGQLPAGVAALIAPYRALRVGGPQ